MSSLEPLQMHYQRDINCLADPDRNTRKRSLSKLSNDFFGRRANATFSDADVSTKCQFFKDHLQQPLLQCLSDPVEGCRSQALALVRSFVQLFVKHCASSGDERCSATIAALSPQLYAVLVKRIGSVPLAEPSEELRCEMLQLARHLVSAFDGDSPAPAPEKPSLASLLGMDEPSGTAASATTQPASAPADEALLAVRRVQNQVTSESMETLALVVTSSTTDSFPDSKIETAKLVIALCAAAPEAVRLHYNAVLRALILNQMGHQRSKVRQHTIVATQHLFLHGGGWMCDNAEAVMADTLLPFLRRLAVDRAAGVRKAGVEMVYTWMVEMPSQERTQYDSHFVYALLNGLADETPDVQAFALAKLQDVAGKIHSLDTDQDTAVVDDGLELPEPFTQPPTVPSCRMVRAVLRKVVPDVLNQMADWTNESKRRAVAILRNILVFAQAEITDHLHSVVASLCLATTDEEKEIAQGAVECAELIGRFVDTQIAMQVILPRATGHIVSERDNSAEEGSSASSRERQGALQVLASLVKGFKLDDNPQFRSHVVQVLWTLNGDVLLDSEEAATQRLLVLLCDVVIDKLIDVCETHTSNDDGGNATQVELCLLLRVLLQLAGNGAEGDIKDDANELLDERLPVLVDHQEILGLISRMSVEDDDNDQAGFAAANAALRSKLYQANLAVVLGMILCGKHADLDELISLYSEDRGAYTKKLLAVSKVRAPKLGRLEEGSHVSAVSGWTKFTSNRIQFDQLIRRAGTVNAGKAGVLGVAFGVIFECTQPSNDPDLRLTMLALLESMVNDSNYKDNQQVNAQQLADFKDLMEPFAPMVVTNVVQPHLVWTVGRVASTIRKVSVFCLTTLLAAKVVPFLWIKSYLPAQLMATMRTCLDDHDADTRKYMCCALSEVFAMFQEANVELDDELVRSSYHDLIKRMDDASDGVRTAACEMLVHFVAASPKKSLTGTPVEYMVDTLMIHLDDTEEPIRVAVCNVLVAIVNHVDAQLVLTKATNERTKHRTSAHCDELIALAKSAE